MKFVTLTLLIFPFINGYENEIHDDIRPKQRLKLVGGTPGSSFEFPYQISIQLRGSHICSGALITMEHVLTVAHCVYELHTTGSLVVVDVSQLQVVAGTVDKLNSNPKGHLRYIKEIHVHEEYLADDGSMDNDIALLKTTESFIFSPEVMPVMLRENSSFNQELCTATSWGVTHINGLISRYMMQVKLIKFTQKRCKMFGHLITENMLCAGSGRGRNACQGESGSPLLCDGELTGLVSWGYGCISVTYPMIFTNITRYIDWIEEKSSSNTLSTNMILYLFPVMTVKMILNDIL